MKNQHTKKPLNHALNASASRNQAYAHSLRLQAVKRLRTKPTLGISLMVATERKRGADLQDRRAISWLSKTEAKERFSKVR